MFNKKILLLFFSFLFLINISNAQDREQPPLRERMFFGGNFWMSFGTYTNIEVSPLVGFQVRPRLAVGSGIIYRYYKYKYDQIMPDGTHMYGFNVFSRYHIIPSFADFIPGLDMGIFVHVEYEGLSLDNYYDATSPTYNPGRFWLNSWLIGGGISQRMGQRGAINFTILYNLNESANSIESNPVIRIGINF
ncbi:MAG: hypothetical protein U9N53_07165 [Bacteroidota bacterium]|nr:hypothetical protein [Bacteroidota bacterium]